MGEASARWAETLHVIGPSRSGFSVRQLIIFVIDFTSLLKLILLFLQKIGFSKFFARHKWHLRWSETKNFENFDH